MISIINSQVNAGFWWLGKFLTSDAECRLAISFANLRWLKARGWQREVESERVKRLSQWFHSAVGAQNWPLSLCVGPLYHPKTAKFNISQGYLASMVFDSISFDPSVMTISALAFTPSTV